MIYFHTKLFILCNAGVICLFITASKSSKQMQKGSAPTALLGLTAPLTSYPLPLQSYLSTLRSYLNWKGQILR